MLDQKYVIDNIDEIIKNLNNRQIDCSFLNELIELSKKRKELIFKSEKLKKIRNIKSKNFSLLVSQKKNNEFEKNKNQTINLKKEIDLLNKLLNEVEKKIRIILEILPNIPDKSVPIGTSKNENIEIRRWGIIPIIKNCKDHTEIANNLDIIDFKRGVKLSGPRFVIYKGMGARLERSLINLMLDQHVKEGFIEVVPSILVHPKIMYGAGNLPKFADDAYYIEKDNLYLIPTSEVPVTNMYCNEILSESQLPIYHSAYTPCFRKEAGSAGKDTKGIIRLHQFNKVEMIKITSAENSFRELEKMVNSAENILKILKIPYRVILLCTGDMGFSSSKTYDLEVWIPSKNKYIEVSSCSNCKDFQSRRMNMKYRDNKSNLKFTHTLNGSGLAIDRVIAAILEIYQNDNGSVNIPDALQLYLGGKTIIK